MHFFLAIFSEVHEFVRNSLFSSRSASFVIFSPGAPLFSDFQQSARVCQKQRFLPNISTFCHFRTGHTTFKHFEQSARVCRKQKFSARDQNVLSFSHWVHFFLATFSEVHEFVQNILFSSRSAPFVIFALGAPPFSDSQQNARVCTKQRFQNEISMFCHFRTERRTF